MESCVEIGSTVSFFRVTMGSLYANVGALLSV